MLSRDKGASSLVLLPRFDRIWFIFLFTCFQGKENVAEGATSLSSICLQTAWHLSPLYQTPSAKPLPNALSLTTPSPHSRSFYNIPFLSS